jgi:hypothetical protein
MRTDTAVGSGAPSGPLGILGETLGRYRLERLLGVGASGVVYSAFDPRLERKVAIKILRIVTPSAIDRERLLREARAMARLAHPNVVTVYEADAIGERNFVVMELVQGTSLAAWLSTAKPTGMAVLHAFLAAGRGLIAAHAAGIVHRDFKPHNILRDDTGRVMVTDFGIAREVQPAAPGREPYCGADAAQPSLTMTGALIGTPAYMAAEQWTGGAITAATDQFAFCVALWEALAGARPYVGNSIDTLRSRILRGPAGLDASRIPRRLRAVLVRGLDPDPARRWPSMSDLLARLARMHGRARTRRWVLASAATAATIATAASLLTRPHAAEPPDSELINGDLEVAEVGDTVPAGWIMSGGAADEYEAIVDRTRFATGSASGRLRAHVVMPSGYGTLMQSVPAGAFRGRRVRLRAQVSGDGVSGRGDLWVRVQAAYSPGDGPGLGGRWFRLAGSFDWLTREVVFNVPEIADSIQVGIGLAGAGTLWIDAVTLEAAPDALVTARVREPRGR